MKHEKSRHEEIHLGTHGEDYGSWMSNPVFYMIGGLLALSVVLAVLSFTVFRLPWLGAVFSVAAAAFLALLCWCGWIRKQYAFGGGGMMERTHQCLLAHLGFDGKGTLLDVGCGSGILSIAALKLGAASAAAVDIDDKCRDVAYENAALNGIGQDTYTVRIGDVLGDAVLRADLGGGWQMVVANIVADVIIGLSPLVRPMLAPGGLFLCSGIIDDRAQEVADRLRENGWEILETRSAEGWFSYLCR